MPAHLVSAIVGLLALVSAGTASAQETRELARHGAWTVFAIDTDGARTCFASAKPKSSTPEAAARGGQPYLYISAWPKDGVKAEVSIATGYQFRAGSTVTLTIGATSTTLFTTDDRAFVADPTAELKLIDAMKKSSSMLVEGLSAEGRTSADVYTLAGLTPTLAALTQGCK
jgi:hypothetical protein